MKDNNMENENDLNFIGSRNPSHCARTYNMYTKSFYSNEVKKYQNKNRRKNYSSFRIVRCSSH